MNDIDLEKGSGDSWEDEIPNFENDIFQMVGGVNMLSNNNNTRSTGKIKERDLYASRARKKRTSGIGVQLLSK